MIFWTGYGYVVLVFVMGMCLILQLISRAVSGTKEHYDASAWPIPVALILAGILCSIVGHFLANKETRVLIDPKTNEEVVVSSADHTFMFIPVRFWGPILILIAGITYASKSGLFGG